MPPKSRKNVGLIGLGIIGSRVAGALRAAGFQVYVWNRSAQPAPNFLGSPSEVANVADIIQIFVADAAALYEVIESMADALTPDHLVMCSATVGPEAVIEAAKFVQARGARFLDAPFTGSRTAAEKRQLVYYVGGEEAVFERAKPVLEATSKALVRVGEIGHASTLKIVTNMISAATVQTLAEGLAIVQKAGLDPALLTAAIAQNACRSGVIDLKLPKMIAGDYEPHFSLKHMFKDVQLGIEMANWLDLEIPITTVTAGVMFGALSQGWGDLDFSAVSKIYAPNDPEPAVALPTPNTGPQAAPPATETGVTAEPPASPAPQTSESSAPPVQEKLAKVVELPSIKPRTKTMQRPRAAGAQPLQGERVETGPPKTRVNPLRRWFGGRKGD